MSLYITRLAAWAPGIESPVEWDEWALGKRDISFSAKSPELAFTEPIFRRRLSQISKMTVQVIHDLLPFKEDSKIFFISLRGEISRQYQINKMLIEDKELTPAAFSLSVFNAPPALATIALGLKGGYTALYPSGNAPFSAGLASAQSALLCENQCGEVVFVYADEQPPPEYEEVSKRGGGVAPPLAFALLLSRNSEPSSVPLSSCADLSDPLAFLKQLLLKRRSNV